MSSNLTPELIADYECVVGEGPMWHPLEKRLYWGDIVTGRLFRYDPATGQHEQIYSGDLVGGFTVQADGALLLFGAKGSVRIWREGALTTVIDEIPEDRDTRFNDVIADPEGRVFCGTMPTKDRPASLYRLALEKAPAGSVFHAIADEGIPTRDIAEVIGRHLGVPVESIAPAQAGEHFGWIGAFFGLDAPASSALTQERLGWRPVRTGLIEDLEQGHYFAQARAAAA